MNELTVQDTHNFTLQGKDSYISQGKLSEISGIPQQTISDWIAKSSVGYITNDNNQLHVKSLGKLLKVGSLKSKPYSVQCDSLLDKVIEAGAIALVYSLAGVPLALDTVASEEETLKIFQIREEINIIKKRIEHVSSDYATSASIILDEWGIDLTVPAFNKLLQQHRLLTKRDPKLVTRKGLQYGVNFNTGCISQPRWYRHTFTDLLTHINYKD